MYKINKSQNELAVLRNGYFISFKDYVRKVIYPFVRDDYRESFTNSVGQKPKMLLTMRVNDNSQTYNFLTQCMNDDTFLRKVLAGSVQEQIDLIQDLIQNGHIDCIKNLTKKRAVSNGWHDGDTVDDFNTIIKEIFVTRLFDGKNLADENCALDKDWFVKNLGLRICPYCGRAYIYRVVKASRNGLVSVKPQIDHFLPKSAYPFLALSFMNLIPCCSQCNMSPCKVDNDPLDDSHQSITKLMHPYYFDDENILFRYGLQSADLFNSDSYLVGVGYSTRDYKHGYNHFLAIDKLYAEHRQEVCNMFGRAEAFRAATNNLYSGVGVSNPSFPLLSYAILGYALNPDEESKQLLYKFKKDILLQMFNSSPVGKTYYYDWQGVEAIFHT